MNHVDILRELKSAAREVDKQAQLIKQEMEERGSRGQLWNNGSCKAWPAYEAAVKYQTALRKKHGV